jgi:hypothetical protein
MQHQLFRLVHRLPFLVQVILAKQRLAILKHRLLDRHQQCAHLYTLHPRSLGD